MPPDQKERDAYRGIEADTIGESNSAQPENNTLSISPINLNGTTSNYRAKWSYFMPEAFYIHLN